MDKPKTKEQLSILFEVIKWGVIVWLILPVQNQEPNFLDFVRVVIGILLFIVFTGKLLFDTIFNDMIKQRDTSLKKDLLTLAGILLVVAIMVGFTIFAAGLILMNMHQKMNSMDS